jgi:hypothetical protein
MWDVARLWPYPFSQKNNIDKFGRFTCKFSTCKIMPCVSSWPFDLAYVETIG